MTLTINSELERLFAILTPPLNPATLPTTKANDSHNLADLIPVSQSDEE